MFKVLTNLLQNNKHLSSFVKIKSLQNASSTTINATEIAKFTRLSSFWWDEIGEIKPLHAMNKLRVPFIRDCLINRGLTKKEFAHTCQPLKDLTILEVGCGGGILTEPLARLGSIITGIDMSSELIEVAKNHATLNSSTSKLSYFVISVEDHVKSNFEKYDAVVASEVVEHVTNKELFLESCVKCLKPGGSVFITTMSKTMMAWFAGKLLPNIFGNLFLPVLMIGTNSLLQMKHKIFSKIINAPLYLFTGCYTILSQITGSGPKAFPLVMPSMLLKIKIFRLFS